MDYTFSQLIALARALQVDTAKGVELISAKAQKTFRRGDSRMSLKLGQKKNPLYMTITQGRSLCDASPSKVVVTLSSRFQSSESKQIITSQKLVSLMRYTLTNITSSDCVNSSDITEQLKNF